MITIIIYEELGELFSKEREITNVMLNKKQAIELMNWLIDEEFEFKTIPDGCNGENIDINKIKLKCLAKRIFWYLHGESYLTEKGFKHDYAQMLELCEKTKTNYDQII